MGLPKHLTMRNAVWTVMNVFKGIHNYVRKANISVYRHQWFIITQY